MRILKLSALALGFLSSAVCSFAAVDTDLLALIPQNSQFVIGINVIAARNSAFGQYLSARLHPNDQGFEQFTALTGFDPKRDLESVVFAGIAGSSDDRDMTGILLARGIFDQAKIRSAALAKGLVVQNFSGVDFFLPGNGRQNKAFAFLDSNVVATGSVRALRQAVASRSNFLGLDTQLQQLITKAGTDNDIWFASTVPASRFATHLQPELNGSIAGSQSLESVTAASGGLQFGSSVQLTLDAVARSGKDASALADVVRFAGSLLQMKGQSDPNSALLAAPLDKMLLSVSGQNVHVSLSLPETALEQLADARARRRPVH